MRLQGFKKLLLLGAYSYPALCIASLYLTWFVAWASLGHMPRPNLDDPKYIGLFVDIPYFLSMFLLMGGPGAFLLGVLMAPVAAARQAAPGKRLLRWILALAVLLLLWAASLWFLRADPWEVSTWYMD
jgi:hypothetical protein